MVVWRRQSYLATFDVIARIETECGACVKVLGRGDSVGYRIPVGTCYVPGMKSNYGWELPPRSSVVEIEVGCADSSSQVTVVEVRLLGIWRWLLITIPPLAILIVLSASLSIVSHAKSPGQNAASLAVYLVMLAVFLTPSVVGLIAIWKCCMDARSAIRIARRGLLMV